MKEKLARTIALYGFIAGTLDILAAFLSTYFSSGKGPDVVLKFVASGVFGLDAFSGGAGTMAAGLFFHYVIAFGWTILFFILIPQLKLTSANWILLGLVYGVLVWLMMNLLILPLSKVPKMPIQLSDALKGVAILMVAIGLPIAYGAAKFYQNK